MHDIATRLHAIRGEMCSYYKERDDAVLAMMLAVLCRQNVFLLGPPGTAKSELVRYLVHAFTGARYYETLLSKNKPAEKVTGPLDLKRFREDNEYVTRRKGFLTDVHFAFLDEVGRMSPILGDDLLPILNEGIYHEVDHDTGRTVHEVPLITAFTASNDMITDQSDTAAALWDRLHFRVTVDNVADSDNFKAIMVGIAPDNQTFVSLDELRIAQAEVDKVKVDDILDDLVTLRNRLKREAIDPSSRRWRQSMQALRANAWLNGRDKAIAADLAVLRFTLWSTVESIEKVHLACAAAADPFVEPLLALRGKLTELDTEITDRIARQDDENSRASYAHDCKAKLGRVRDELDTLLMTAGNAPVTGFKAVSDLHLVVLERNLEKMLDMEQVDVRKRVMEQYLGDGDGGNS